MAKHQKISEERRKFLQEFIAQDNINTAQDIQEALKDMFKDTLQEMLETDMVPKQYIPVQEILKLMFQEIEMVNLNQ